MDDLFAPPTQQWRRISPAYAMVLRIRMAVATAILGAAATVPVWLLAGWVWGVATIVACLAWALWQWVRLGRLVRSWGFVERDDDLYLTHGLWFKELTAIPYGRMQAVKVESGPLARAFGLASVELVTASIQSGAKIPGLPQSDAEQLRDRLIEIGIGDDEDAR
ncbi:PH domain-containing protein [Micropruina sonneratiae]|uniref:PH domain-containing protein n=1 Tax=Micropruina sonneratiae TaxID=2986940 RepID=UPI002227F4D8|nr:PH domain-containing protein [Micropruina sp. KQZ13P-5]MCW3158809.1 PH domain-containing protein [Micropruina sp. KQZ13P-5]